VSARASDHGTTVRDVVVDGMAPGIAARQAVTGRAGPGGRVRGGRGVVARGALGCMLAILAAAPALGGARAGAAGEATDMLGRPVSLPERPVRVVSLAPSITETVYAVGAGDRLVGVTDDCDYPPEAARHARIGGIATPSFEAILALRPDLVLATAESNHAEHVRRLVALGLTVYVIRPVDFGSVLESIERIGAVLGRGRDARALVDAMRRDADAVARAVAGAGRPRVLYVVWRDPVIAPGRGTLLTELIGRAGGESITAAEPLPYPRLSLETIVERRPEVVIVPRDGGAADGELPPGWERLGSALRAARVRTVDGDLLHRPGPRMVQALRALARAIHPERRP
jgi:iron complex transport system substrate-binding protein